ncbi:hypothetical protein [Streptomyces sp. NPDC004783]|uniref:hypothetical protein n=1 Tax=Streptomyces sp. NPDC004783 TaxID=3154459 RepID=UPI0033AEBE15
MTGPVPTPALDRLRPEFIEHASIDAIRAQYERAQAQAELWSDRARDLFLLLCQREDQTATEETSR